MAKTVVKKGFGFFSLIFAFLFGVICAVGGAAFAAYHVVTQVKIKDAVNTISGGSINYSEVITEEYAEKTVFELLGSAQTLASKASDGTLALSDLNAISPAVKGLAQSLADILNENLCVSLTVEGEGGLLSTPLNGMGDLLYTEIQELPVADVLKKLSPDLDLSSPVLKTLFYDDEGNAKRLNEIGGVFSEGENGETAFDDLKLKDLIPVDENSNVVIKALAESTVGKLRTEGVTTELDGLKIRDFLGEIDENNALLNAVADCNLQKLKTEGITDELDEIKISDLVDVEANNPILNAIKDTPLGEVGTTLDNLTIQAIYADEIYVDDGAGGKKLEGHWKYLLTNYKTGEEQDYKLAHMEDLINNMTNNVKAATVRELYEDGFIEVDDPTHLNVTIPPIPKWEDEPVIGEMRVEELIRFAFDATYYIKDFS